MPQLFDQYVAFGADTRFRQRDGLVFEDPALGVTTATIYPPDDPYRKTMAEVRRAFDAPSFAAADDGAGVPAAVYTNPWNDETYIALLQAWLSEYRRKTADWSRDTWRKRWLGSPDFTRCCTHRGMSAGSRASSVDH